MPRRNFSSGAPWESVVGYSRAVRVGNVVHVSGTTATGPDGKIVGVKLLDGHGAARVRDWLAKRRALPSSSRTLGRRSRSERLRPKAGRAHGEVFGRIRPAATMVEVRRLISPEMLVEIEAEAIIEAP